MTERLKFNFLPLSLNLETLGGVVVPIVLRGTRLPAKRQQRFTTAEDNQKKIRINLCLGESPIASKNLHLADVELSGIPDAPHGEPQIDVIIKVDTECKINVLAKVSNSGKDITSEINEVTTNLTAETIMQMIEKAKETKKEDQILAEHIEWKNKANSTVDRAEKYLQNQQKYGISNSIDSEIEKQIANLGLSLQDDDWASIKEKSQRLETLLPKDNLYGNFGDIFSSIFGSVPSATQQKKQSATSGSQKHRLDLKADKRSPQSGKVAEIKKGLFTPGQNFDAKSLIRDLFASALHEITIIDAYVGEDVLNLLTVKRIDVRVKLLTGKVSPVLQTLSRDFNRQYKGLEIRSSTEFHDRFIIVDGKDYYHFGASLEHLGNKTFMFSKLEEPAMIDSFRKHLDRVWSQAVQVV